MVSHSHNSLQDIVFNKDPAYFSKFIPQHFKVPSSHTCHRLISIPYPIGLSQQLECTEALPYLRTLALAVFSPWLLCILHITTYLLRESFPDYPQMPIFIVFIS